MNKLLTIVVGTSTTFLAFFALWFFNEPGHIRRRCSGVMRVLMVLLLIYGTIVLTGCNAGDMVDSKVLAAVQEYFPTAEISKPQPNHLKVDIHLGNITEKFAAKTMQGMLQQYQTDLEMGFAFAGYKVLIVDFEDFQCAWSTTGDARDQFFCSSKPLSKETIHGYLIRPMQQSLNPFVR